MLGHWVWVASQLNIQSTGILSIYFIFKYTNNWLTWRRCGIIRLKLQTPYLSSFNPGSWAQLKSWPICKGEEKLWAALCPVYKSVVKWRNLNPQVSFIAEDTVGLGLKPTFGASTCSSCSIINRVVYGSLSTIWRSVWDFGVYPDSISKDFVTQPTLFLPQIQSNSPKCWKTQMVSTFSFCHWSTWNLDTGQILRAGVNLANKL